MADPTKDQAAAAKEQLSKDAEARKKQNEETAKRVEQSKPTPTQEENDRARMGEDVVNKEDDGSGDELTLQVTRKPLGQHPQQSQRGEKSDREKAEADKQAYATRQQTPKPSGG